MAGEDEGKRGDDWELIPGLLIAGQLCYHYTTEPGTFNRASQCHPYDYTIPSLRKSGPPDFSAQFDCQWVFVLLAMLTMDVVVGKPMPQWGDWDDIGWGGGYGGWGNGWCGPPSDPASGLPCLRIVSKANPKVGDLISPFINPKKGKYRKSSSNEEDK
ncbi:unnamed protein product [Darwinula stevensoni]|uniref:Uncharacterized protein n=1 Tax=Darwinula stevensoni TaxID=69355 RepID=A0A7R8XE28_9CRUS|nr:unnamed protein product [Darwinula stevensoni]CAG0893640.1 unnamed protein product [Darwinula stevensoni]